MLKLKLSHWVYKNVLKPVFFSQDPEKIHNLISKIGEFLGRYKLLKHLTSTLIKYDNPLLQQNLIGIKFENPIGLSAGFDYDGHMAEILPHVGFGFNTVGTVTAKPYEGNKPPRLKRLPKSKSLLVNKGFKSDGVDAIIKRLRSKNLDKNTLGISVGSSNISEINTIEQAISDYCESFQKLKNESYIKYFELNISCPNTALTEGFGNKNNLNLLLTNINKLKIEKPIFIKMANELSIETTEQLIETALNFIEIKGFIFSNLVKDRTNENFDKDEIQSMEDFKGNFSGKPTYENSNKLISNIYKKYGKRTLLIGCGGVFSAEDAYEKIKSGASLVQLITGMIYEGPQLIGEINEGLVELLKQDGFQNISEAVGKYHA